MELKGKTIVFLGDSITQGVGTSDVEQVYWNQLARATGARCIGFGVSGTRIAPQRFPSEDPAIDEYYALRARRMPPQADIVVVFGGTNDFGHGDAALGTPADRTNDTFYGALHLLLLQLMEQYPDAVIVPMTPLHRLSEDETVYNEFGIRRVGPLVRYVDAILEVAAFYGLPVVDLYRQCPIQPKVEHQRIRYMPDGLHPSDAGNGLIAHCLQRKLEAL